MEHVVNLLAAIAWPVASVVIAFLFRAELRHAAVRLSSLKYKEFQANFDRDLGKLEDKVRSLKLPESKQDADEIDNEYLTTSFERLSRIAEISPRAAIMEAWRDIEVTTKRVTDIYNISIGGKIAGVKAIRQLVEKGLLPESVISIYESMRRLRARAAHAADFAIEAEEAERYIETAHEFHLSLLFLIKQAEHGPKSPNT